ncbi:AAA family ATPase [Mediterraneibacter glycyrrhizinilyticus]|uniref:AAA family ATPase n=1 Tax=Mediterraneibacter glycyrrhizinilyticus TaxID=342942 RepID=UPI00265B64AA|nr:AAA family ATPase [Mediterraneibacter glycyrrhizinilyticus]MCF2567755.1 AAA family ATPase [Mediterraneibacter glycyrrhizinilyticus]
MNWIPLPVGVENFEDLRRNGYYFVDKTLFIKELLDMKGKVNLFTRPRRFGKTLNMSMLRYFFEARRADNSELFQGLKIMDAGEEYLAHMGKYPVISISLKSMKQYSYDLAFEMLKKAVREEYKRHWNEVEASGRLEGADLERYLRLRELEGTESDYADSLKFLSDCLYTCTGQKSIILIDEYDVPLENAYFSGFYDRMVALIRSLFESALKTNDYLEFAVVTGCLRISKESIFTGLNNLKIMSITSRSYAEHFGFTPGEVEQILKDYGLEENLETVRQWYDGYQFGETEVYNPWSVINYVDSCRHDKKAFAKPYWSNTSSNSIVRNLVEHADISVKQEIEALIEGGTVIKPIHEDITYDDIDSTQDNLWNFLFFTGYLKKIREEQDGETIRMEMAIPNSEVRYVYKNAVLRWFEEKTDQKELSPLYESILNGDPEKMAEILSENLMETISFYDYQESYYHGFLAGMLKNIGNYIVQSNRESGNGRPDILLKYPSVRGKAVIIEIKISKTYQGLEEKCDEALRQIEEQEYEEALREEGYQDILKYGVAFYKKECMAKMQK